MRTKNFARRYSLAVLFGMTVVILFYTGCKDKTEVVPDPDPAPANPYNNVDYDTSDTPEPNPDPYSITGLHKNIFTPKCNVPGCHDGTFEPDFRSVQSAYSTLVYQQVNKVTVNGVDTFDYRVIPFDTTNSFIHERVTTPTTDYMPSNGNRLSQAEINQIDTWIMNGARDMNGNIPSPPDNLPFLDATGHFFYNALDSFTVIPPYFSIIDTNRYMDIPYNPFLVNAGANMRIIFWAMDDITPVGNLLINQCKLSLLENDFSAAQTVQAVYINLGAPNQFWMATFPVTWPPGTQVYFRYYMKDATNPGLVEFPRNDHPVYYKLFFSFIVQ